MDYDLFLSHNRQDKAWVRELVRFLRLLGLRVFFDEDSIRPGQDFVLTIEHALEASRTVVLIVSRAALRSRWVSFETALRLIDDPIGATKNIIPVLAEQVDQSEMRLSVRRLDAVDLTNPDTRETEFLQFLRSLGIPEEQCRPMTTWPQPVGVDDVHVADINSVLQLGWTGEMLLEQLIALDYQVFDELVEAHEGAVGQWAPVFMDHPDTWRILTTGARDIVGYWHFVPLFDEQFQRALAGELLDSEITADKIQLFELPGTYDIYFVSFGLMPRFRRPKAVTLILRSFVDVLADLARNGITISRVCANAYTASGVALCRSLGMSYRRPHAAKGQIFEATMTTLLGALPTSVVEPLLSSAYGSVP